MALMDASCSCKGRADSQPANDKQQKSARNLRRTCRKLSKGGYRKLTFAHVRQAQRCVLVHVFKGLSQIF